MKYSKFKYAKSIMPFLHGTARGFTLIELLVVIAIIGLLSSIVLASLSSARSKGNDGKIQEQVNSVKSAMEIYYSANSSYSSSTLASLTSYTASSSVGLTGAPFSDTISGLYNLLGAGAASNWPSATSFYVRMATAGRAYAMEANLSTGAGWCVDSTGVSKTETSYNNLIASTSAQSCP